MDWIIDDPVALDQEISMVSPEFLNLISQMFTKPLTKSRKMESRDCQERQIIRLLAVKVAKSLVIKVLGALEMRKALILLVPEGGIEPPPAQGRLDFESSASTSFTTPALALVFDYTENLKSMSISY